MTDGSRILCYKLGFVFLICTDGSRILCYKLGFVFLIFTVIITNKPRIPILMICVRQSWLLWQQAIVNSMYLPTKKTGKFLRFPTYIT